MKREHFVKVVEEALDSLPKLLESGPFVGEVLPEVSHGDPRSVRQRIRCRSS
jgi:hypothetical protein